MYVSHIPAQPGAHLQFLSADVGWGSPFAGDSTPLFGNRLPNNGLLRNLNFMPNYGTWGIWNQLAVGRGKLVH